MDWKRDSNLFIVRYRFSFGLIVEGIFPSLLCFYWNDSVFLFQPLLPTHIIYSVHCICQFIWNRRIPSSNKKNTKQQTTVTYLFVYRVQPILPPSIPLLQVLACRYFRRSRLNSTLAVCLKIAREILGSNPLEHMLSWLLKMLVTTKLIVSICFRPPRIQYRNRTEIRPIQWSRSLLIIVYVMSFSEPSLYYFITIVFIGKV